MQVAWSGFLAMCRSCSSESSLIQRDQEISVLNLSFSQEFQEALLPHSVAQVLNVRLDCLHCS